MVLSLSSIADRIKKCSRLTELEHVYGFLIKNGASHDAFLTNQFITSCSGFLRMDYALLSFQQMETPNVFVYNAMIRGFVHCGHPIQALDWYVNVLRAGISPTSFTFPPLIRACACLLASQTGEALHGHLWRYGLNSHLYVQTSLIDFYSKLEKIGEARKVFDEMPDRDGFAWTAMILAYVRAGDMNLAASLFQSIQERNPAAWNIMMDGYARSGNVASAELLFSQMPFRDIVSWTTMISCYAQSKRFEDALSVFEQMTASGIAPDGTATAIVISLCAHLGALELGREIHRRMVRSGIGLDVYLGSALVDMYAKCGDLDESLLVFLKLRDKNLFCWNSMLEGLSAHGRTGETLTMFDEMVRENIQPNGVTFVSVLSACARAGLVEEGCRRFSSMERDYGIAPEVEHYGCIVDLQSKAGLLEEALSTIRSMRLGPNSVVWGALLGGCRLHKNLAIGRIAVSELMILEPNNRGYYHLLVDMFARENRWGEVKATWAAIKEIGDEKRCPGSSWVEMGNRVHRFSSSDNSHPDSLEIYGLLKKLNLQMKLAGHVPELFILE